ncbi:MAG: galactokinase, partial [Candidatus Thorarchaeota archaeon]
EGVKNLKEKDNEVWIARAPGRVEVLGNHTDYNSGLVMAATIDRFVWAAGIASEEVEIYSLDFDEGTSFSPKGLRPNNEIQWDSYARGVYWAFERRKHAVKGLTGIIHGNIPIGAGLSSSAALEVALVNEIAAASGLTLNPRAAAMIAFEAERLFCGISCGVMDQFTSQLGQQDSVLAIKCGNLRTKSIQMNSNLKMVITDSKVSRPAGDVLNERRAECLSALKQLNESGMNLQSLSDIGPDQLYAIDDILEDRLARRVRHVVSENARVREGIDALEKADLRRFGVLLYESHASSKELYEVSHPKLDLLVDIARTCKGVYGSRMTGAGLGGATLSLVAHEYVQGFKEEISEAYESQTNETPDVYVSEIPGGVVVERLE